MARQQQRNRRAAYPPSVLQQTEHVLIERGSIPVGVTPDEVRAAFRACRRAVLFDGTPYGEPLPQGRDLKLAAFALRALLAAGEVVEGVRETYLFRGAEDKVSDRREETFPQSVDACQGCTAHCLGCPQGPVPLAPRLAKMQAEDTAYVAECIAKIECDEEVRARVAGICAQYPSIDSSRTVETLAAALSSGDDAALVTIIDGIERYASFRARLWANKGVIQSKMLEPYPDPCRKLPKGGAPNWYLFALSNDRWAVRTGGFVVADPDDSILVGCRVMRVRQAFEWDLGELLVEMQATCDDLEAKGYTVLISPRLMDNLSEQVEAGLGKSYLLGSNWTYIHLDPERRDAAFKAHLREYEARVAAEEETALRCGIDAPWRSVVAQVAGLVRWPLTCCGGCECITSELREYHAEVTECECDYLAACEENVDEAIGLLVAAGAA